MIISVARSQGTYTVTASGVKSYMYGDTLKKNTEVSVTYGITTFAKNVRYLADIDTLATGYIKGTAKVYGSLDNQNWTQLGSNLALGSATATATKDTLFKDVYYRYIKVYVKGIDSTQYGRYSHKILIEMEE